MPKLIRTSDSATFLVEAGDAQWRFPCTFFPCFAAMFSVLRNHDCFDDCAVRVCRRLKRSRNPLVRDEDILFFEAIADDNDISDDQYDMMFIKSNMLSRSFKAGMRSIIRCPAS